MSYLRDEVGFFFFSYALTSVFILCVYPTACQRVSSQILKIPLKTFWCRSLEHMVHFQRGHQ